MNMPFTIAALDSSSANLSARYLDSQIYAKAIKIERAQLVRFLKRVLDLWLTEATRISGLLPSVPDRFPHKWCWPSIGEHADPDKVASAQAQRLKNGTGNLADEIADAGDDWEDKQQLAARTLGLSVDQYRERLADSLFPPTPEPAAQVDQQPPENPNADLERLKAEIDAYGIAVRAGVLTPQPADEDGFRQRLQLAAMSPEARKAWADDKGVRRPITITPPAGAQPAAGAAFGGGKPPEPPPQE
jgi:hypothetical protein